MWQIFPKIRIQQKFRQRNFEPKLQQITTHKLKKFFECYQCTHPSWLRSNLLCRQISIILCRRLMILSSIDAKVDWIVMPMKTIPRHEWFAMLSELTDVSKKSTCKSRSWHWVLVTAVCYQGQLHHRESKTLNAPLSHFFQSQAWLSP